ncbi:MAG: hypothetical protein HN341_04635 [Verrucomicrobia bacterium]|nr:hypothetical protein [Verrucomicrobiota bacterium]
MAEWWHNLTSINRGFFCMAAFFSVFFLWQMLAALLGLGDEDGGDDVSDGGDADADLDADVDDFDSGAETDSAATVVAFKLLSIRAIITFCTLFSWGSALYLSRGDGLTRSMGISAIWGLAGMGSVALLLSLLPKLAHTGTKRIASALGAPGTVYLDIPEGGAGEVRVAVSDVISFVKAREISGKPLKAGTPIVVKRIVDQTTVEVETLSNTETGGTE